MRRGDLLADRYEIIDYADSGCSGWVARTKDNESDGRLVLKIVDPKLVQHEKDRENFQNQCKRFKKINSDNLVPIIDCGEENDLVYYTMPVLEGLSLRKIIDLRLDKSQLFDLHEVLPIFYQLVAGLTDLGRFKFHGVMTPRNIIILPDLLKIGAGFHWHGLPHRPYVAKASHLGVNHYLAPEIQNDSMEVDARADVFSLGIIFSEMLTGIVPGRDSSVDWDMVRDKLGEDLGNVVERAIALNHTERWRSPQEFMFRLDEVIQLDPSEDLGARPRDPDGRDTDADLELSPEFLADDTTVPDMVREHRRSTEVENFEALSRAGKRGNKPEELPNRGPSSKGPEARWVLRGMILLLLGLGFTWFLAPFVQKGESDEQREGLGAKIHKQAAVTLADAMGEIGGGGKERPAPSAHIEAALVVEKVGAENPSEKREAGKVDALKVSSGSQADTKNTSNLDSEAAEGFIPPSPSAPPKSKIGAVRCPREMVGIAAGMFVFGTSPSDPMRGFGDLPSQSRRIEAFCVDRFEYPNREGEMPFYKVTWGEAKDRCYKKGKRLCTEEEWERACRGQRGRRFPTKSRAAVEKCNLLQSDGVPSRLRGVAKSGCRTPEGLFDMAGNVAEWTSNSFTAGSDGKTVKGGSIEQGLYAGRCSARFNRMPWDSSISLGFRCCIAPK
ncbi:MAG: SUMF1/EgtB/PvdO family nonheme iron enzyme [Myxococcota bacterium]|nr:SUMF1/EgtB/PvdO family nonheme iron enzyme [Myxococcota bacterium]